MDILDSGSLKIQYNRNRYYDYYTGRFATHDPLGITPNPQKPNIFNITGQYKDGMSLYEYVMSQPVMVGDPFGLWHYYIQSAAERSKYARAFVVPDKGESYLVIDNKLAQFMKLDLADVKYWAEFHREGKQCGYLVPNSFLTLIGEANPLADLFLKTWGYKVSNAFDRRGFYSMLIDADKSSISSLTITNVYVDKTLWGFATFGHGKKGDGMDGYFVWRKTLLGVTDVVSSSTMKNFFRYGAVINYHCYAELEDWQTLVSSNGSHRRTKGLTSAASGPRGLSPAWWGSWDSLVGNMVGR